MNPHHKMLLSHSAVAAAIACCVAHAATVVTTDRQEAGATGIPLFTPTYIISSTNNVLAGLLPSAVGAGNFTIENSGGLPILTNGTYGSINNDGSSAATHPNLAAFGNSVGGSSITYTFAPTQLTSIFVYGGWNDKGRDQQSYTIQYSINNGTSYVDLVAVNFNPAAPDPIGQSANRVGVTDNAGPLAGGAIITNLRFNANATENGYAGLAEIAAYAVPEPSVAALGALGVLGLLRRRRA